MLIARSVFFNNLDSINNGYGISPATGYKWLRRWDEEGFCRIKKWSGNLLFFL